MVDVPPPEHVVDAPQEVGHDRDAFAWNDSLQGHQQGVHLGANVLHRHADPASHETWGLSLTQHHQAVPPVAAAVGEHPGFVRVDLPIRLEDHRVLPQPSLSVIGLLDGGLNAHDRQRRHR